MQIAYFFLNLTLTKALCLNLNYRNFHLFDRYFFIPFDKLFL